MKIIKFKKKIYEIINSCEHSSIRIDRANKLITCRDCSTLLDPFDTAMEYLDALDEYKDKLNAYREGLLRDTSRNKLLMRRIENRKRTKCHHCAKMTSLSIKEPTLWEVHAEVEGVEE